MCLVLKLWFTGFWGEYMYIYIFQEIFTLNSDTVNLWPFNSSILLLPLTRTPAFSLCI